MKRAQAHRKLLRKVRTDLKELRKHEKVRKEIQADTVVED